MDKRKFDIIIYGASGFTGQFVVEELATCTTSENLNKEDNFKWAIAGRNIKKLEECLSDVDKNIGINVDHIPIIKADSDNYNSILNMCKQTNLVISVIGPYRFYGEYSQSIVTLSIDNSIQMSSQRTNSRLIIVAEHILSNTN